jgi:hypothetical protein
MGAMTSLKVFVPKTGFSNLAFRLVFLSLATPAAGILFSAWCLNLSHSLDAESWATALAIAFAIWIAALYRYLFRPIYADPNSEKKTAKKDASPSRKNAY